MIIVVIMYKIFILVSLNGKRYYLILYLYVVLKVF